MYMYMCMIKLIAPICQDQLLEVDQHQSVPANCQQKCTTTPNNQQQLQPLTSIISPQQVQPGNHISYNMYCIHAYVCGYLQ